MDNPRKKSFWDVLKDQICALRPVVRGIFGIAGAVLIVLLVSLAVVDPGTATYVLVIVDIVGIGAIVLVTGSMLYICRPKP